MALLKTIVGGDIMLGSKGYDENQIVAQGFISKSRRYLKNREHSLINWVS